MHCVKFGKPAFHEAMGAINIEQNIFRAKVAHDLPGIAIPSREDMIAVLGVKLVIFTVISPGFAAEAIEGFHQVDLHAALEQFLGDRHAGEPTSDDNGFLLHMIPQAGPFAPGSPPHRFRRAYQVCPSSSQSDASKQHIYNHPLMCMPG